MDGLVDDRRPGRPATVTAEQVEQVVVATLESTPKNATHWSRAKMAERSGLSKSTIGRIWKAFELRPHRADGFKPSNDPLFVENVYDVIGLHLNPPDAAVVPFNTADGTVISSLHRRYRSAEFKKFLSKIDTEVPDDLQIHLICDNYGTHKAPAVRARLTKHPRFHIHFTPTYSSRTNQVERFFDYVTCDLLQRSDHRSVQALEADIRAWITEWTTARNHSVWTKTAEQTLESLARLLKRATGAGH